MSPAHGRVPFLPGSAEALLRVGEVAGDRTRTTGAMRTGPWSTAADGTPSRGSLGVLIDDVLGYAVVSARPPGHWAVSTELFVDFCGPMPGPEVRLTAESSATALDPSGGVATGRVLDASGGVVATAVERLQFVRGEPGALAGGDGPAPWSEAVVASSVEELLDAGIRVQEGGAVLSFTPSERLANPAGGLHGGLLFTAVETVARAALQRGRTDGTSVHLTWLRPLRLHEEVVLEATVQHSGRSLGLAAVVARNPAGKVCALATVTGRTGS